MGLLAGEDTEPEDAYNSMMTLGGDPLEECEACKSMYYGFKWVMSDG